MKKKKTKIIGARTGYTYNIAPSSPGIPSPDYFDTFARLLSEALRTP